MFCRIRIASESSYYGRLTDRLLCVECVWFSIIAAIFFITVEFVLINNLADRRFFLPVIYCFMASLCSVFLLVFVLIPDAKASDDLWEVLKQGGYVVLMRHAPVEPGDSNGNPLVRDPSCKSERNISNQGKRHAEVLGRRFREYNIPVSKVMHSPFCRTTATAHIVFGKAYPAKYLSLLEQLSPDDSRLQTEKLNQIIGTYTGEGNLVLVTHEPNINAVSFELMKHLDFLVIDPNGEEEFEELGVIKYSDSN